MEKMNEIINFEWDKYIVAIIEGIRKFAELVKTYFPRSYYNFEDPAEYEF